MSDDASDTWRTAIEHPAEMTFHRVGIPGAEGEFAVIVDQDFLGDLLYIVPTIRNIDGEEFPIHIGTNRVGDCDFVRRDYCVHC